VGAGTAVEAAQEGFAVVRNGGGNMVKEKLSSVDIDDLLEIREHLQRQERRIVEERERLRKEKKEAGRRMAFVDSEIERRQ
jgi:hypothetical protein